MSARTNPLLAILEAIRNLQPEQLQHLFVLLDEEGLVEAGDYFLVSKRKLHQELRYWHLLDRLRFEEHEKYLRQRNRHSDPDTIEQDADIHRKRTENPQRWSWKALGRHFDMTDRGARFAYDRHQVRLDGGAK
jgi:hypothetical protein